MTQLQKVSDSVCALSTKITNWSVLNGKIKHRLDVIEDRLNNLHIPDGASPLTCGGLGTTESTDVDQIVCDGGVLKRFVNPSATQYFHLIETPVDVFSGTTSGTATFPDFPSVGDKPVWAILNIDPRIAHHWIGSTYHLEITLGGRSVYLGAGRDGGDTNKEFGIMVVIDNPSPTVTITFSGVGGAPGGPPTILGITIKLVGYIY